MSPFVSDDIPTETESSPQSEAPTEPVASDTEEPTDDESVEIEGKPIEVDQLAAHVAALRNHQDDLENEFSVRFRERPRARIVIFWCYATWKLLQRCCLLCVARKGSLNKYKLVVIVPMTHTKHTI